MAGQAPGSPRRSWRATQATPETAKRAKRVKRYVASVVVLALIVTFALLLIRPLFRPFVHLVCVPVSTYDELSAPAIVYAQQDAQAFDPVVDRLYVGSHREVPNWTNLRDPAAMDGLGEALKGKVGKRDVLVFYLSAHGIAQGETAYLLLSKFDPSRPGPGMYKLDDVLAQVQKCEARLKLLILDTGRIAGDARLGMVCNEFPRLLEAAVTDYPETNLWVLNSNSFLETSHVWHAQKRSVFGHYVTEAFSRGGKYGADYDGDGQIDLAEFADFVTGNVSGWVQTYGDTGESQTPLLLQGHNGRIATDQKLKKLLVMPAPREPKIAKEPTKQGDKPTEEPEQKSNETKAAAALQDTRERPTLAPYSFLANFKQDPPSNATDKNAPASPQAASKADDKSSTSAKDKPAGAGDEKAKSQPAKEPADAKPADTKGGEPAKAAPPSSPAEDQLGESKESDAQRVRRLLKDAWTLRDEADRRETNRWTPVDYAPHLWREFQDLLLSYETRARSGTDDSSSEVATALRERILAVRQVLTIGTPHSGPTKSLVDRIARARPRDLPDLRDAQSLALANLLAGSRDDRGRKEFQSLADEYKQRVSRSSAPEDFGSWLDKAMARPTPLVELNLASRLRLLNKWDSIGPALETSRRAELAAAVGEWCTPWVQERIDQADRERLAAEVALLSGSRDREREATNSLNRARTLYDQALSDAGKISRAIQVRNDLMFRAPYYVRWFAQAHRDRNAKDPSGETIRQLLVALHELATELQSLNPGRVITIDRHRENLERLRDQIESPLKEKAVKSLISEVKNNPPKGYARRIEDLLSTPLLESSLRMDLLYALDGLAPEALEFRADPTKSSSVASRSLAGADEARLFQIAQLEVLLVRLAGTLPSERSQSTKSDPEALLRELDAARSADAAGPSSAQNLRSAYAALGDSLKNFYLGLPGSIAKSVKQNVELSNPKTRADSMKVLRSVDQALRVVDARDTRSVDDDPNPIELLRQAHLYDLLDWHRQRFERGKQIAVESRDLSEFYARAASSYRKQVQALSHVGPPIGREQPKIEISLSESTPRVDLTGSEPKPFDVRARVTGKPTVSGSPTVTLKFDPNLMEILPRSGTEPVAANKEEKWSEFTIKADAEGSRQYRIRAKPGVLTPEASVTVVVSAGGESFSHYVAVGLPVPEPVEVRIVPRIAGTTKGEGKSTQLRPFPNKTTDYELKLFNTSDKPETIVKVELAAIPEPPRGARRFELDEDGRWPAGVDLPPPLFSSTDPIVVPPKQLVSILFAEFKPEPTDARPSVRYGLVWTLTSEKGSKKIQPMLISPRRPKTYIKSTAEYDHRRSRLTIKVKRLPGESLPKDGCKIALEVAGKNLEIVSDKLSGDLKAPNFETEVFVQFDVNPKTTVIAELSVDEYPRAFIYEVDCANTNLDIPPVAPVAIRFTNVTNGKAFNARTNSIPVKFRVDAPDEAFEDDDENKVEVLVDDNRNQVIDPIESPLAFFNNRQVNVLITEIRPGGVISFQSQVGDFEANVPAGVVGDRVGLLGRVTIFGGTTDSTPEDLWIILDKTPPKISIPSPPRPVRQGEPIQVSVQVTDDESQVESVEFAFDRDGSGEFPKDAKGVFPAEPDSKRVQWTADIPTVGRSASTAALLVRATNTVGIVSTTPERFTAVIRPKPQAADTPEPMLGTIKVKALVNDKALPDIDLVLQGANKFSKLGKTDARGEFTFKDVPPGQYRVLAKGTVINRDREASADAEVTPEKLVVPVNVRFKP